MKGEASGVSGSWYGVLIRKQRGVKGNVGEGIPTVHNLGVKRHHSFF